MTTQAEPRRSDRGDRDRDRDRGPEMIEKVVYINRVSKVVSGGRRFSFSAVVVVGDGQGNVGAGMGKAREVPEAIRKGGVIARKHMLRVPMRGATLTHEILARYGAARVMLRPASAGTGIIAGGGVRAVMEAAGVHDVLTKSLGSSNPINVVRATLEGLKSLRDETAERQRRREAQEAPPPPPPRPRRVEPPRPREPRPPRPESQVEAAPAESTAAAPAAVSAEAEPATIVPGGVAAAEGTEVGAVGTASVVEAPVPAETPVAAETVEAAPPEEAPSAQASEAPVAEAPPVVSAETGLDAPAVTDEAEGQPPAEGPPATGTDENA